MLAHQFGCCFSPPHLFLLESGAYECVSPRVLRRGLRRGRGHLYPGFNGRSFAMQFFNWESFEKTKTLLVADSDLYWCFTARPVRSNKILDTHFCWCHLIFSLADLWKCLSSVWFNNFKQARICWNSHVLLYRKFDVMENCNDKNCCRLVA